MKTGEIEFDYRATKKMTADVMTKSLNKMKPRPCVDFLDLAKGCIKKVVVVVIHLSHMPVDGNTVPKSVFFVYPAFTCYCCRVNHARRSLQLVKFIHF